MAISPAPEALGQQPAVRRDGVVERRREGILRREAIVGGEHARGAAPASCPVITRWVVGEPREYPPPWR